MAIYNNLIGPNVPIAGSNQAFRPTPVFTSGGYVPPQVNQLAQLGNGGYFESAGGPQTSTAQPVQYPNGGTFGYTPLPQLQASDRSHQLNPATPWTFPGATPPPVTTPTPPTAVTATPTPAPTPSPTPAPAPIAPPVAPPPSPITTAPPAPSPVSTPISNPVSPSPVSSPIATRNHFYDLPVNASSNNADQLVGGYALPGASVNPPTNQTFTQSGNPSDGLGMHGAMNFKPPSGGQNLSPNGVVVGNPIKPVPMVALQPNTPLTPTYPIAAMPQPINSGPRTVQAPHTVYAAPVVPPQVNALSQGFRTRTYNS